MRASRAEGLLAQESPTALRRTGWLALGSAAAIAGLIAYGAWVRASGSGLGCPDWPLCQGGVLPEGGRAAAIEYGHRLFAGLTMIMVAAVAILGFQQRREAPRAAGFFIASLLLILGQAGLGGVAVLMELPGMIVLAHLALAMAIMGLLTVGALAILVKEQPSHPRLQAQHLLLSGAAVILIGGAIVATNTGFGCLDLPLCQDDSTAMATWLHTLHRVLGIALLLGLALAAMAMRRRGIAGPRFPLVVALGLLVVAQAGVGVSAVALTLPEALRVLHVALAALIWWGLVGLWALSSPSSSA